jgi:hypothetical protein
MCSVTTIPVFALPWRRLSLADVSLGGKIIKNGMKIQDEAQKSCSGFSIWGVDEFSGMYGSGSTDHYS